MHKFCDLVKLMKWVRFIFSKFRRGSVADFVLDQIAKMDVL